MFKLHDYFRSSACFRVRIALNLKGLEFATIPVNLANGDQYFEKYELVNPQQLVPTLHHDDKILMQSLAIIEYINELYPTPRLLPSDVYEKALVRAFALSIAADIHPLNNLRVLKYLTQQVKLTETQKNQWYQHWIAKGLAGLEKQIIINNRSGRFCFGDSPTLADICLVPQMYNARRFDCDLTSYPNLVRIDANCQQNDAFLRSWPMEVVRTSESEG